MNQVDRVDGVDGVDRGLYRCRQDRRLAGVAAGVAEFFGLDPTLVRVLWFISIFFGGISIVLYIGLALIMPLEPVAEDATAAEGAPTTGLHRHAARGNGRWTTFLGIVLILLGSLALLHSVLPDWVSWRYLWPVFLIGIGALLVVGAVRRGQREA